MIDIQRYARLKDTGLTDIIKEGDLLYLTFKRFDVENGSELDPEKQLINREELENKTIQLRKMLEASEDIFDKINNL